MQTRRYAPFIAACACGLSLLLQTSARAHPQPSAAEIVVDHRHTDAGADNPRRAEVVASFDTVKISTGELEDAILAQNPFMQQRYVSPEAVRALLDRSVRFELLAAEAERRGYGRKPEVQLALKQSAVQTLIKQEFDDKITVDSVPAEDVKKYYDAHLDEFVRGEGRRVSLLALADEASAKALLPQAQAADMAAFRELVRSKSTDPTNNKRGGDLHYFNASGRSFDESDVTIEAAIAKAAFALRNVGDTSGVVKTADGFGIIKLTGVRPAHDSTFAQSAETVRSRLWRERRQAAIDDTLNTLKKSQKVVVHPELVTAVKLDEGPALPPKDGLPSGFPHTRPAVSNTANGAVPKPQ